MLALVVFAASTIPANTRMLRTIDTRQELSAPEKHRVTPNFLRKRLEIAWLLSFPNSGTSYTIKLIRHLSMTHTATNYGHEVPMNDGEDSLSVYGDQMGGPYWMTPSLYPSYSFPSNYVLVKR